MRFSNPPAVRAVKYDWTKISKRLTRKPGEWLRIYVADKQSYAVAIRNNKIAALKREHGFESRTAKNNYTDRTCTLWLRYNPEADTRLTNKKAGK